MVLRWPRRRHDIYFQQIRVLLELRLCISIYTDTSLYYSYSAALLLLMTVAVYIYAFDYIRAHSVKYILLLCYYRCLHAPEDTTLFYYCRCQAFRERKSDKPVGKHVCTVYR